MRFVGVNVKDNDPAARAFERSFGITYPSITTADSGTALLAFRSSLPASAIPSTLVVDRRGRVAARVVGATTYTTLRGLVDEVLAERPLPPPDQLLPTSRSCRVAPDESLLIDAPAETAGPSYRCAVLVVGTQPQRLPL
ncbi:MAG: TlpA family protein disulfide reductase [Actinomycetota bacterium]|nr:TlpA family protein disulfide reductase [Actinomycetota bacterium]